MLRITKHGNEHVSIYKTGFPEGKKEVRQRGGNMSKNFPGLKKDRKAWDKKANGVLNRIDKKTKINTRQMLN